jgi:hypothetical protein
MLLYLPQVTTHDQISPFLASYFLHVCCLSNNHNTLVSQLEPTGYLIMVAPENKNGMTTAKDPEQISQAQSLANIPWCDEYEKMISGMA